MKRIICYFIGANCIAVGVVLNIRLGLGVSAFSTVMYAMSKIYHISLGMASIACYLLFIVIQCMLSRKINSTYLLEIPVSFVFGWLIDLYDVLIPSVEIILPIRCVFFIMTMFVTGIGVYLMVQSDFVLSPTDGIVKTISEVFRLPFSAVKNTFDISLVVITVLLCVFHHAPWYGIGVGTVLNALLVGRIIKLYEQHFPICFTKA